MASLIGAGLGALLSFVTVVVVARAYDISTAGVFFAATSLFIIVSTAAQVGVDQGLVRFVAHHQALGEFWAIRHILKVGYLPVAVVSTGIALAAFLTAQPIASLLDGTDQLGAAAVIRVLALAVPVAATYEVTLAATRGFGTMRFTVIIERIGRPLTQSALVATGALAGLDIALLALAWVAPYALGLIGAMLAVNSLVKTHAVDGDARSSRRSHRRDFWRFARAQAVARLAQVALLRADIVLVSVMLGPPAAAIYTAVSRFVAVGQVAVQAVQQAVQPRLASLLALRENAATQAVLKRVTVWFVAFTWPLYLTIALNSSLLLGLAGEEYRAGCASLTLLSLAMLLATAAGPVDVLLLMSGRSTLSCINMIVALIIDIALCIALLPLLGVLGAAVAWAVAILTRNVIATLQVRHQLCMQVLSRPLLAIALACLCCFGIMPGIVLVSGFSFPGVLLSTMVGTLVYAWFLWRWRRELVVSALVTPRSRMSPASVKV